MELFVGSDLDGNAVAAVRCAAAFPCKPAHVYCGEDSWFCSSLLFTGSSQASSENTWRVMCMFSRILCSQAVRLSHCDIMLRLLLRVVALQAGPSATGQQTEP